MCFSATANFTGSAVLGAIGVATIAEVKHRRELLFASLPCLFALHQFTEGFVWLGINGKISHTALQGVAAAYVLYAQGLLPFLLPLSVLLIEPTRHRRSRMMYFLALGTGLTLYILWGLMMDPLQVYAHGHSIVYNNVLTTTKPVAVLYVIATCGALFFSGFKDLVILGWLNMVGLIIVMLIMSYAFTSVWCAYAAVVSVVIYFFFRRSRGVRPVKYVLAT
ncbi:MAG: DUF6629 family protein [Bryobacteraceae bacterium]|jgi:hypothetical protein